MSPNLKSRIVQICEQKIESKGDGVGLSFYAFFKNKNDDPEELMTAALWWIQIHKLDHFERAVKIRDMVLLESEAFDDHSGATVSIHDSNS